MTHPHVLRSVGCRSYVTSSEIEKPGAFIVRPWMLPHRLDYGLRGTADSVGPSIEIPFLRRTLLRILEEQQHAIRPCILLNSFQTNPDLPGVEKLCGCLVDAKWLSQGNPMSMPLADIGCEDDNLAGIQRLFMVKGWNRSICMLGILLAAWEDEEILQARLMAR